MSVSKGSKMHGDPFEVEIEKLYPRVMAFARSLTKNSAEAEDLTQEALYKAFKHRALYQPGTNMIAWLCTITRNTFVSEKRKPRREQAWDPEFENSSRFSTGLGLREAESVSDMRRLLLCLACLPDQQSHALVAVGYLGMSYEEAAERLGCAAGTAKSRVNRARVALVALMEKGDIRPPDLKQFRSATHAFPKTHPLYPIARAYEELYAALSDEPDTARDKAKTSADKEIERSWEDLVASGALDDEW